MRERIEDSIPRNFSFAAAGARILIQEIAFRLTVKGLNRHQEKSRGSHEAQRQHAPDRLPSDVASAETRDTKPT